MSRDCPYAHAFPGSPALSPWKDRAVHAAIPIARSYTRYGRSARRRQELWSRLVRSYLAWHSHTFRTRTAFGATIAGDTQEVLQQHVYYFGMWEANLTRWLSRRLRPGDAFVDVGANIGYFSLLGSKLVGDAGTVVAIEALPTTFERLRENLDRNHCRNVRAVNVAAAEAEGTLKVFRGPDSHTGLATVVEGFGHEYEREVEAAPLMSLLEPDELLRARVIKIDVEGSELGVVKGLATGLKHTRPDLELVVEMHPWPLGEQGHRPRDVANVLASVGFNPYGLDVDYTAESFVRDGEPVHPRRLSEVPDMEMDVVFSREDRDAL